MLLFSLACLDDRPRDRNAATAVERHDLSAGTSDRQLLTSALWSDMERRRGIARPTMRNSTEMRLIAGLVPAALLALISPALADAAATDLSRPTLPTFALTSPPADPSPVDRALRRHRGVRRFGQQRRRGGFGGGGYAGYDRELDNGIVLGVQGERRLRPRVVQAFGRDRLRITARPTCASATTWAASCPS